MKNGFSFASEISLPVNLGSSPGRDSEKVVMISSHPAWIHDHGADGEIAADSVDLVRVFHEVLERLRRAPVLNMDDEGVTVAQMLDQIWRRIAAEAAPLRLSRMLRLARTERTVICLQLALLELVRLQAVLLQQDRSLSDILLKRNPAIPASSGRAIEQTLANR